MPSTLVHLWQTWAVKADSGGGEGVQLAVAEQGHVVRERHQLT